MLEIEGNRIHDHQMYSGAGTSWEHLHSLTVRSTHPRVLDIFSEQRISEQLQLETQNNLLST